MGYSETIMAQLLTLNNLLNLQNSKSSISVANFLNGTGEWISNDSTFGVHQDYTWYKALPGEQFEPHTKDQIRFTKLGSFDPAITYITLTKANFDNVKASIQSTMTLDGTLIHDPKVKMYKYSNANATIEMIEPFQPQKDGLFMYVFIVYDKQDYNKGFRIK